MIITTCAALAAALMNPASAGQTFRLTEDCKSGTARHAIIVTARFAKPVTVEAGGHVVAGIEFRRAANVIWRGGTIEAPLGHGWDALRSGPGYYGVWAAAGTSDLTFEGVTFTNARKAVVWGGTATDYAHRLTVRFSRFTGTMEDGVIAGFGDGLVFAHNRAEDMRFKPTACTLPDGTVRSGLSSRDCAALGGVWRDGWHGDVLQLIGGTRNVLATDNHVRTLHQGLTQMGTTGSPPVYAVRFAFNDIRAGRHGLTLYECQEGCLIDRNVLGSSVTGWRMAVLPGTAKACGNVLLNGFATAPGQGPCL